MFCQKCGSRLNEGAVFCSKCGYKNDAYNEVGNNSPSPLEKNKDEPKGAGINMIDKMKIATIKDRINENPKIKKYLFIGIAVFLIFFVVIAITSKKGGSNKEAYGDDMASHYQQYMGKWRCVGEIDHPDGKLARSGKIIEFTEKGIDCTDLFGLSSSWSNYQALQYYNEDGNDYFVDFTGDPMGFLYDSEKDQIILYTPSSNYPSDNPYDWNSRFRFERN